MQPLRGKVLPACGVVPGCAGATPGCGMQRLRRKEPDTLHVCTITFSALFLSDRSKLDFCSDPKRRRMPSDEAGLLKKAARMQHQGFGTRQVRLGVPERLVCDLVCADFSAPRQ